MISINKALVSIDLGLNKITDLGVKLIADALKVNSTLAAIHFADNPISNVGAQYLINTLSVSKQVKLFRLRDADNHLFKTLPDIDQTQILRLELINFNNTLWLKSETENAAKLLVMARMLLLLDISFDLKFYIIKMIDTSTGPHRSFVIESLLNRCSIGKLFSRNRFNATELLRRCYLKN